MCRDPELKPVDGGQHMNYDMLCLGMEILGVHRMCTRAVM